MTTNPTTATAGSAEILRTLREKQGLTQDGLAERIMVSRQAVSRWETGETVPGVETLKLLSKVFDVSINTLLGAPRQLVCQCCGMPLEDDALLSRETDGSINEDYCKWCYTDGSFAYPTMESLIDYLSKTFSSEQWPESAARAYYAEALPKLKHWGKQ
jgi:transcriptional regulator with XRE-family HTH domain